MDPDFVKRIFDPRYMLKMSQRSPEAALAWIQLAKEIRGESFLRGMDPDFVKRIFHPRYMLEIGEWNPEVALAWIQFACEVGAKSFLERYGEEAIDGWFSMFGHARVLRKKSTVFVVPLRLAQIMESPRAIETVRKYLVLSLYQPSESGISLEMLPLVALSDLQWLAKKTDSPEISSALNRIVKKIE